MTLSGHLGGSLKAPRKEGGEARQVTKKPYVRPRIACQDLEHAVRGGGGSCFDGGGHRTPHRCT